uniref:Os08g0170800 protein n=1 Tax=Hydatigena taeniaeformis TaxID=6205 RepID=A0A0R3XAX7_HYDTA
LRYRLMIDRTRMLDFIGPSFRPIYFLHQHRSSSSSPSSHLLPHTPNPHLIGSVDRNYFCALAVAIAFTCNRGGGGGGDDDHISTDLPTGGGKETTPPSPSPPTPPTPVPRPDATLSGSCCCCYGGGGGSGGGGGGSSLASSLLFLIHAINCLTACMASTCGCASAPFIKLLSVTTSSHDVVC